MGNWDDIRERIVQRDEFTCSNCGAEVTIRKRENGPTAHVHHKKPRSEGGEDVEENLTTLCPLCHTEIHGHGVGEVVYGDLRPIDEKILEYLEEGAVTPHYCHARLENDGMGGYTRSYIQQRIIRLEEFGLVENLLGVGLYELVDDPERVETPAEPEPDQLGGENEDALDCPDCGRSFDSFDALRQHLDENDANH